MGRRIGKHLALAVLIVCLCMAVVFSFVPSSLAQEQTHVSGEIAGGYAHSYPIELKVGEVISGEIIVRNENLTLNISDSTGNSIYYFGSCSTSCNFYYVAEVNGTYHLVIGNPDGYSIGTRGYNIYYSIGATTLAPGTGSGTKITADAAKAATTTSSMTALWWVLGIIAFFVIAIGAAIGTRRRRRRTIVIRDYDNDDDYKEVIIEKTRKEPPSSDRIRDLYFPKALRDIHQKGLNDLGQRQRDALKRAQKRLRR